MRVLIMFRPRGEAPERAAEVAAALEANGHVVHRREVPGGTGSRRAGSPDVIHAVGSDVAGAARRAAPGNGTAIVCDLLRNEQPSGRDTKSVRSAATWRGGGTVLARDPADAGELRAKLGLPYLPTVVGSLDGGAEESISMLLAVYDRLPGINPQLPLEGAAAGGRFRRWLAELREPIRGGAVRRPGALISYVRGRRLRARGRLPAAVDALTRAVRRSARNPTYELYAAKALREAGETERALDGLDAIASSPVADSGVMGEVGVEFTRLGEMERATAVADSLADGNPGSPGAWAEAARVYAALGDLEAARRLALRAAEDAPDGSTAQRTAALALEQAGEPSRALGLARQAGAKDQQRRLAGLLRELDPRWSATLEKVTKRPDAGSSVLSLLEVSLPQAPSGYAYRSRDLLVALRDGGYEPLAATRLGFPASRGARDWSPVESVDGVVHHRFNVPGLRQYSGVPLDVRVQENAKLVLEVVRHRPPRAIIAGTPDLNGRVGLSIRSATGVPFIYDVRGFPEMSWATRTGGSDSELYRLRRAAETACATGADAVITLSETMKSELVGRGVNPKRIFVVPHIADIERFSPRTRDQGLARSYGLDGRFVVGSVTSLTDYEGIDDLLRAVARARAEVPELTALIVGDGAYRPTLEELVTQLGIGDSVVFTGRIPQDQVPDHYALLDLFAIPRRDLEVCRAVTPLKPFEALGMGIPILASDLPALAEIVSASDGGRLVPAGSDQALAQAVVELSRDPSERERLGRSGREYVLAQHTPERATAALSATLEGLVGENGSVDES